MKYLILLLISFSALAQTRVEIKPNNSKYAPMQFEEETKKLAIKRMKKIAMKSKWLKGEWTAIPNELNIKKERNPDRELSLLEEGAELVNLTEPEYDYYSPLNYEIVITDITEEVEAKKLEVENKKAERSNLKKCLSKLKDAEVMPPCGYKLLMHYAKSLKE